MFPFQPAVVIRNDVPEQVVWAVEAHGTDESTPGGGRLLLIDAEGHVTATIDWAWHPVHQVGHWVFVTPDDDVIVIRQAMPGDAASTGASAYAPPDQVLRDPRWEKGSHELMALVSPDDDYVMTLVLAAPSGIYARYSHTWFAVSKPAAAFGDARLVGVEDHAIDLYDGVDTRGMSIHIGRLPTKTKLKPRAVA